MKFFVLSMFVSLGLVCRPTWAQDTACIDSDGWPCAAEAEVQLEATVVERHNSLSAGSTEIDYVEFEHTAPTSGSELLAVIPGLRIVQHGSEGKAHQIFLRGFDAVHGSDVEVRVDGIPLNERGNVHGHGYVDLYGVIPEVVSELRVSKGAFLPWQGDFATAGSVDFELAAPRDMQPGILRTEVGHRGRLRIATVAAPDWKKSHGFVAGESVYDAGFGPSREAGRSALLVKLVHPLLEGWSIDGLISGQAARWQSAGARRLDDADPNFYASYDPGGLGTSERALAKVGLSLKREALSFDAGLFGGVRGLVIEDNYTGQLLYSPQGDRKRQEQWSGLAGALARFSAPIERPFPSSLMTGLEWRADMGNQTEHQVLRDGTFWQENRELITDVQSASAYLGWALEPVPKIRVLPSARVDAFFYGVDDRLKERFARDAMFAFSPRLALSFSATSWLRLLADYGRGLRSPEPRAIAAPPQQTVEDEELSQYNGGRAAITQADALEAGFALTPLEEIELRAAGFATFIEREVVFDHVSNTNLELDGTRRLGAELSVKLSAWHLLCLKADATYVDARFQRSRHPVPGTSPWSGAAGIWVGREVGPHGSADLLWNGRRHLAHGASVTGSSLLDVSAGWRFAPFDISLFVDNALNSELMDGAYHYASWFDTEAPRSSLPMIHYTAARPLTARIVFTAYL